MDNRIKIEDVDNFVKDSKTGAIINTDTKGYKQYMTKMSASIQTKEDIKDLQLEMSQIKELLIKILEKK
jgi:hypothetical protein|tara:strand:+ start:281 stop:487 length:207 start_codon:yes stop_codon:yes gene_type:complete